MIPSTISLFEKFVDENNMKMKKGTAKLLIPIIISN
jgi:hypothetical protein